MFQFQPLPLIGAFLLTLPTFKDDRGSFSKIFQSSFFETNRINFRLQESYFSVSRKDVIRGMHFQLPPHQHAKIVYCPAGSILDVIVDLRVGSPSYGSFYKAELSAENNLAYYIPEGFAHGFKALTDHAVTCYLVSSEHHKELDTGILFNSFGMDWQCKHPIVSDRDLSFHSIADFVSPFTYS